MRGGLKKQLYPVFLRIVQVLGSKGMLQVENVPKDSVLRSGKEGVVSPMLHFSFPERYKEAYLLELDTFLSLVLDPSLPCPIGKEEVLLSSRVAAAAEISHREGRLVALGPMGQLDN